MQELILKKKIRWKKENNKSVLLKVLKNWKFFIAFFVANGLKMRWKGIIDYLDLGLDLD